MKSLPTGLQAHLDSGTTTLAWCWKITRCDGGVFGFTDHDLALTFAGTLFEPESGFVPSEIRAGQDFSVDAQDVEGALSSDRITETDILDGRWDNAEGEVWRVNWTSVDQRVLMRRGNLGDIRRGRTSFVAEVRSLAHWLNQTVGRTYQFSCDADLGDARCGVNLSSPLWSATGRVATSPEAGGSHLLRWAALRRTTSRWVSSVGPPVPMPGARRRSRASLGAQSPFSKPRCDRSQSAMLSSPRQAATSSSRPAPPSLAMA